MQRSPRWWWFIAVVALVAGGRLIRRTGRQAAQRPAPAATAASPADAGRVTVPALGAGDDAALAFPVATSRTENPPGQMLRIDLGGGEANLTLFDVAQREADPNGMAFGRGVLEAARRRGAGVVEAVGGWLKTPVPPVEAGELRPFQLSYVRLGSEGGWQANKLFLEDGELSAEVFLNLSEDGKRARFVEKDEEYREPLLALLALAIRDGHPARHTPATDARFSSAEPLVGALAPIPGMTATTAAQAWFGGRWAAVIAGARDRVLVWDRLDQSPRPLGDVSDGDLAGLQPSPTGDRLALKLVHPRAPTVLSSDDPGEVLLLDLTGGAPRSLVASSDAFRVGMTSALIWSPDGRTLAVGGDVGVKPVASAVRLYDAASGRQVGATGADLRGRPVRWEKEGIVLEEWVRTTSRKPGESLQRRFRRWQPGKAVLELLAGDGAVPGLLSPDGRFRNQVTESALEIVGPRGVASFAPRGQRERLALDGLREDPELATWVGPAGLVLAQDAEVVLDLQTTKLRYLLPDGFRLQTANAVDGRVIVRDASGSWFWGTARVTR